MQGWAGAGRDTEQASSTECATAGETETARPAGRLGGAPRALPDGRRWLAALALTCVLLAAKNLEAVPFRGLHAAMLTVVCGAAIAPAAAADLELRVLAALGWRLGPFHHAPGA
jgi:hypothetical protein